MCRFSHDVGFAVPYHTTYIYTKERIAQSKRARADSLALVD